VYKTENEGDTTGMIVRVCIPIKSSALVVDFISLLSSNVQRLYRKDSELFNLSGIMLLLLS
jgi:hypothetical protein